MVQVVRLPDPQDESTDLILSHVKKQKQKKKKVTIYLNDTFLYIKQKKKKIKTTTSSKEEEDGPKIRFERHERGQVFFKEVPRVP